FVVEGKRGEASCHDARVQDLWIRANRSIVGASRVLAGPVKLHVARGLMHVDAAAELRRVELQRARDRGALVGLWWIRFVDRSWRIGIVDQPRQPRACPGQEAVRAFGHAASSSLGRTWS